MSQHFVAISSINSILAQFLRQPKGDASERLSARVTVILLALFSAVLLTSHYWGEPINCWAPAQYTRFWVEFVNQYCYVHGTYYAPLYEPLSWDDKTRKRIPIDYYQWVPYVLATQAVLFYLPRVFWKTMCTICGVDMPEIIRQIEHIWEECKRTEVSFENRLRKFEVQAAPFVWDSLKLYRKRSTGLPMLSISYMASKLIYAINATVQFLWLNEFLKSPTYPFWGVDILRDILRGESGRRASNLHATNASISLKIVHLPLFSVDTVVCVLTLNLYYEKIFLFLWFWMLTVAVLCTLSAAYWLYALCFHRDAYKLIVSYIQSIDHCPFVERGLISHQNSMFSAHQALSGTVDSEDAQFYAISQFMERQLKSDGVFIVRQVAANLGHLPAAYLTKSLFVTAPSAPLESPLKRRSMLKRPSNGSTMRRHDVKSVILSVGNPDSNANTEPLRLPPSPAALAHQKSV